jgi:mono/diheme cytochrome c family protein
VPANEVKDFAKLYATNCAGCHGADGKLGPAPPLNDALFLSIVPDDQLFRVVKEGRPNTLMPAFAREKGGTLTKEQVDVLAKGIKSRWATADRPKGDHPNYLAPEGSDAGDKKKGEDVFMRACASCHGDHGQGSKIAGAVNDRAFLALLSDRVLRRYVITGRPDLGMPDYAGTKGRGDDFKPLTEREITDLVALLSEWRISGSTNEK